MLRIAVMGCGTVGSGVIKMLRENQEQITRATGQQVSLKYALDIRPIEVPDGAKYTSDFQEILNDPEVAVVVETIGGLKVAYAFTEQLLRAGKHVVSSNKELVAEHGDALRKLAQEHGSSYLYEAAVGGGVPILRPIRTCLAGNRLCEITGIVNGSTNYLLTRMEQEGLSFSAAIAEAKQLGYVEENPDADVEGWDACRKLAILASTVFGSKLSDHAKIPTVGIGGITERDLDCAHALQGTIKLIAHAKVTMKTWTGWVHPTLVPNDHVLAHVNDVFNGIMVAGDCVGDVMFYGRGAGSLPTASAILSDIIDIASGNPQTEMPAENGPKFDTNDLDEQSLMLRVEAEDLDVAMREIEAKLPVVKIQKVNGMLVVLTACEPYNTLVKRILSMDTNLVQTGIPIRTIQ